MSKTCNHRYCYISLFVALMNLAIILAIVWPNINFRKITSVDQLNTDEKVWYETFNKLTREQQDILQRRMPAKVRSLKNYEFDKDFQEKLQAIEKE